MHIKSLSLSLFLVSYAMANIESDSIDFSLYTLSEPISNQMFSQFQSTMNALDIPQSYIAKLESEGKLLDIYTRRWSYLANQFDKGYEFIPTLRKMLYDAKIPQEFLFLAMAESEFKTHALSPKSAAGIWQIMPATAKELGLVINEYIDERQDPIKSTQAAIKYLQYLHKQTGKWYLAAMAYNCGLGRLNRGIDEAGSSDIEVLLDENSQFLPLETREYLRKIMSMSLAFSNAHDMKISNKEYMLNRGAGDSLAVVQVKGGNSLANVAKGANMTLSDFVSYNRHFKYDFVPLDREEYEVYIPYDRLSYFKQNFKNVINAGFILYKVKKGDTLYDIAKSHHTSIDKIKKVNAMKNNRLFVNQMIKVPVRGGKIEDTMDNKRVVRR